MSKLGWIPTGPRVIVKANSVEEISEGGIILTETTKEARRAATTIGELVAVGKNAFKDIGNGKPWAKTGDIVVFQKYGGFAVKTQLTGDYRLLNDEDILMRKRK